MSLISHQGAKKCLATAAVLLEEGKCGSDRDADTPSIRFVDQTAAVWCEELKPSVDPELRRS
jgi:hypothetical protein